ncbi:hypothetical protein [Nocardia bovistercoris]|uniref:DUF8020 domain-containing protein n=1 Tax=Nocardia bovistercoris TaxID=2785916 RepID=A0A931IEF6_9NOCA|nr:hypothetical protein [Nocardia bovistercoris]MBH0779924.1 hypothetical protein [Nocardia bovistercoris]
MKFGKTTAAVLLTASAMAVTTATAHAGPAAPTEKSWEATTSGVDNGIGYRIVVSPVDEIVTATVANGGFEFAGDGAVMLETSDGVAVLEVPRSFAADGRSITMTHHISPDGHTLTLASPVKDAARAKDISSYDRLVEQIDKNLPGVVGGAIVGGLLGACLFLIWGVSIPLGVLVGGTVGGSIMGGPEFFNAVQAFVTGQP